MGNGDSRYTVDRVVRMVLGVAGLAAVLLVLRYLADVLLPFAAAVVLAYLLNPLVTVFEKKMKRRGLAVAVVLVGLGVVGAALAVLVIPLAISQADRFRGSLTKLRDDLAACVEVETVEGSVPAESADSEPVPPIPAEKSALGWGELKRGWAEYRRDAETVPRAERLRCLYDRVSGTQIGAVIDGAIAYTESEEFKALLINAAKGLAIGGWTVVAFALHLVLGLTGLIIVLLYLVFLLLDFPEYARTWPTFLPPQYRSPIVEFLEQFNDVMRRYFRGQAVVALLMGILFAVGFSLIGLPMAVPLGLFIGLLNMVPYLQTVGLVPAMLMAGLRAVEQDSSFLGSVLLTVLVFAVAQLIQDSLITPRVMGKATGLRPVAILLGVFIWGKLLGFLGLLLAIPLTCLGIAYYRRYVLLRAPEAAKLPAE